MYAEIICGLLILLATFLIGFLLYNILDHFKILKSDNKFISSTSIGFFIINISMMIKYGQIFSLSKHHPQLFNNFNTIIFLFLSTLTVINVYLHHSDNIKLLDHVFSKKNILYILIGMTISILLPIIKIAKSDLPANNIVFIYNYLTKIIYNNKIVPNHSYIYGIKSEFDSKYIACTLFNLFYYDFFTNEIMFLKSMSIFIYISSFIISYYTIKIASNKFFSRFFTTSLFLSPLFIYKLSSYKTETLAILYLIISLYLMAEGIINKNIKLYSYGCIFSSFISTSNGSLLLLVSTMIFTFLFFKFLINKNYKKFLSHNIIFILLNSLTTILIFSITVDNIPVISALKKESIANIDYTWLFVRTIHPYHSKIPALSDHFFSYIYNDFFNNKFIIAVSLIFVLTYLYSKNTRSHLNPIILYSAIIIGISLFFYYYYTGFVPSRYGFQRLFPYLYISTYSIPIISFQTMNNKFIKITAMKLDYKISFAAIFSIIYIFFLFFSNYSFINAVHSVSMEREGYEALVWIKENVSKDSRILTNIWTNGAIQGISEKIMISDGDAPYFRKQDIPRIINIINNTRKFYEKPYENIDFIKNMNITHVLLDKNNVIRGAVLYHGGSVSLNWLQDLGFTKVFESENIIIYNTYNVMPLKEDSCDIKLNFTNIFKDGEGDFDIEYTSMDDALKINIINGEYNRVGMCHIFNHQSDISKYKYMDINYKIQENKQLFKIVIYANNSKNMLRYSFITEDNNEHLIKINLRDFEKVGSPNLQTVNRIYFIIIPSNPTTIEIKTASLGQ